MKEKHERHLDVMKFIQRNRTLFYQNFRHGFDSDGMNSKEGTDLINKARKELDYSPKTWRGDIYNALFNYWIKYMKIP